MKQFFENKKGELTTKQLVTIIVLIVSFIVVLFFIFRLNFGEETNKDVCHNSVILRKQSGLTSGPLDCKTSYICFSGGGECKGLTATDTINIDISKNRNVVMNQTMKAIADEMSDCWWMFGEGKIDYAGGWTKTKVNYAICSIIAFDEKLQKKIGSFSYQDFYNYLRKTPKSSSQTYLQYLYKVNSLTDPLFKNSQEYAKFNFLENIDTSKKYSIITGIDKNILDFLYDDVIFETYIIPTDETDSRLNNDRTFITKA